MTKWDLYQEWKSSSTVENQSMQHMTLKDKGKN